MDQYNTLKILEVVSALCTIAFSSSFDETDSTQLRTALIITGIIGQFICGGCVVCLYNTPQKSWRTVVKGVEHF